MSYRKIIKKKTKKSLQEQGQTESIEINTEIKNQQTEVIKSENLLRYISMGDFSKVQSAIREQISIDQSNYNNDVSDALNRLNKTVDVFTSAQTEMVLALSALNNLLSFVDGKDYFIKGFNNVSFDLSDSNNKALSLKISDLMQLFGKEDIEKLLNKISSSISSSKVIEEKIDNDNDSPFGDKPKDDINNVSSKSNEEVESRNVHIKGNFSEDNESVNENDEDIIGTSDNDKTKDNIDSGDESGVENPSSFDISNSFAELSDADVENDISKKLDLEITLEDKDIHEENSINTDDTVEQKKDSQKVTFNIQDNFGEKEEENLNEETDASNSEELQENPDDFVEEEEKTSSDVTTRAKSFDIANSFSDCSNMEDDGLEENDTDKKMIFSNNEEEDIDEEEQEENIMNKNTGNSSSKTSYFDIFESIADYNFEDEEEETNSKLPVSNKKEERLEEFQLIV